MAARIETAAVKRAAWLSPEKARNPWRSIRILLDGAVTLRFLLKVATAGAIAGSVFGYYLRELRAAETDPET